MPSMGIEKRKLASYGKTINGREIQIQTQNFIDPATPIVHAYQSFRTWWMQVKLSLEINVSRLSGCSSSKWISKD